MPLASTVIRLYVIFVFHSMRRGNGVVLGTDEAASGEEAPAQTRQQGLHQDQGEDMQCPLHSLNKNDEVFMLR